MGEKGEIIRAGKDSGSNVLKMNNSRLTPLGLGFSRGRSLRRGGI